MATGSVVGFVGLDDISLELATSLLRSGYSLQAFEVVDKFLFCFSSYDSNFLIFDQSSTCQLLLFHQD